MPKMGQSGPVSGPLKKPAVKGYLTIVSHYTTKYIFIYYRGNYDPLIVLRSNSLKGGGYSLVLMFVFQKLWNSGPQRSFALKLRQN